MNKPRSINQRDQVQKILDTLHRHSDVISMSLVGRISDTNTDENTGKGIAARARKVPTANSENTVPMTDAE